MTLYLCLSTIYEMRKEMKLNKRIIPFFLGIYLSILLPIIPSVAASGVQNDSLTESAYISSEVSIPLRDQPFYDELVTRADAWLHTPIAEVVGTNPRDTLLNFYAVMADIGLLIDEISAKYQTTPGLFWNRNALVEMEKAEALFDSAVKALDGSLFPRGVRKYLKDEAAIQLKHVLDYAFYSSRTSIDIPNYSELDPRTEGKINEANYWRLPGTSIVLTNSIEDNPSNEDYFFSAETVASASEMYDQIRHFNPELKGNPFVTDTFYNDFIHTPGHLFPPKWYLNLKPGFRTFIETEVFFGETIFQLLLAAVSVALFLLISVFLFSRLIKSLRNQAISSNAWTKDTTAWHRALLILPLVPFAKITEIFIDEYLNFTGLPLFVFTISFEIVYFTLFVLFVFLLFEAIGRSVSELFVKVSGRQEVWNLRRTTNRVMPLCRISAGIVSIFLIYRMLLQLGLSPTLVLALSTVPGLAIGLGASKLLSNLFAGLSLQTDRPVRVGEFCGIGDDLGFITKIGLRSVELQTATGVITIPNAVAEESIVTNYSRHQLESSSLVLQSLEIRLDIDFEIIFGPDHINDLLTLVRRYVTQLEYFAKPIVTVELIPGGHTTLVCIGTIDAQSWIQYLSIKESITVRLNQLISQVSKSHFTLSVSYETSDAQLLIVPSLVEEIVNGISEFQLKACRLMEISEFSYDFKCHTFAQCDSYNYFKDCINSINLALLTKLAENEIVIPYPTAIEIQKDGG